MTISSGFATISAESALMSEMQIPQRSGPKGVAQAVRTLHDRYPKMTQAAIARRVGCTESSVSQVLKSYLHNTSIDQLRDYQDNRADIFDALGHRFLSSVTEEKLAKSKPMEAVTAAAILYDKARLERGQATGINVTALLDVAELIRSKGRQVVDS
jgi:predicted transcriptional regulator